MCGESIHTNPRYDETNKIESSRLTKISVGFLWQEKFMRRGCPKLEPSMGTVSTAMAHGSQRSQLAHGRPVKHSHINFLKEI